MMRDSSHFEDISSTRIQWQTCKLPKHHERSKTAPQTPMVMKRWTSKHRENDDEPNVLCSMPKSTPHPQIRQKTPRFFAMLWTNFAMNKYYEKKTQRPVCAPYCHQHPPRYNNKALMKPSVWCGQMISSDQTLRNDTFLLRENSAANPTSCPVCAPCRHQHPPPPLRYNNKTLMKQLTHNKPVCGQMIRFLLLMTKLLHASTPLRYNDKNREDSYLRLLFWEHYKKILWWTQCPVLHPPLREKHHRYIGTDKQRPTNNPSPTLTHDKIQVNEDSSNIEPVVDETMNRTSVLDAPARPPTTTNQQQN